MGSIEVKLVGGEILYETTPCWGPIKAPRAPEAAAPAGIPDQGNQNPGAPAHWPGAEPEPVQRSTELLQLRPGST